MKGHVNPSVLETLFKHQTSKWQGIAEAHIDEVVEIIQNCNDVFFRDICPDESIREKIRARIDLDIDNSFNAAREELDSLLRDERQGPLLTNNNQYAENLTAARSDRFINGLKKLGFTDGQYANIHFAQIKSSLHLSNEKSAIYDIHDTLKAYYGVAIKRFIDNVKNQVVARNLLGPLGPVGMFTPEYVSSLSEEELESIAGEDYATSNLRAELGAQISRLAKARVVCSGKAIKQEEAEK